MNRRHFLQSAAAIALAPRLSAQDEPRPTIPIGTNIAESPEAFAAAGYAYLEMPVTRWLDPRIDDEAFAAKLAELEEFPLPAWAWNGFLPGKELQAVGLEAEIDAIIEWGKVAFARAKRAGGKIVTFGSGTARACPAGFPPEKARQQLAALLGELATAAANEGIVFAIENLNRSETNLGTTLAECLAIVEESGNEALKLTADIHHMLVEDEGPEILAKAAPRIAHCHIAEKAARTQPGIAGDDFRPYLAPLLAAGYDGRITFECKWHGEPAQAAAPAIEAFRGQLERGR